MSLHSPHSYIKEDKINQYVLNDRSVSFCLSHWMDSQGKENIFEFVERKRVEANVCRDCFECDRASTLSACVFLPLFKTSLLSALFFHALFVKRTSSVSRSIFPTRAAAPPFITGQLSVHMLPLGGSKTPHVHTWWHCCPHPLSLLQTCTYAQWT